MNSAGRVYDKSVEKLLSEVSGELSLLHVSRHRGCGDLRLCKCDRCESDVVFCARCDEAVTGAYIGVGGLVCDRCLSA